MIILYPASLLSENGMPFLAVRSDIVATAGRGFYMSTISIVALRADHSGAVNFSIGVCQQ
ncbi:MAG: hypothetical protein MI924_35805 [Chloroflexales bacterium]|nr:hypothetical protein [Chloroflexales bacterium]